MRYNWQKCLVNDWNWYLLFQKQSFVLLLLLFGKDCGQEGKSYLKKCFFPQLMKLEELTFFFFNPTPISVGGLKSGFCGVFFGF